MANELIDYKAKALSFLETTNTSLNAQQKQEFLDRCIMYNLNPFMNEIYAIKFKSKNWKGEISEKVQIVVSYQVILSVATSKVDFGGIEIQYYSANEPVLYITKDTPNLWCIVTIYKYVNGVRLKNNTTRVDFSNDYKQQRLNSFAQNYFTAWTEKIAYTSIVRKTYPNETQNMYISDEFASNNQTTFDTSKSEEVKMIEAIKQEETAKPKIDKEKIRAAKAILDKLANAIEQQKVVQNYFNVSNTSMKDWLKGDIDLRLLEEEAHDFTQQKLRDMGMIK